MKSITTVALIAGAVFVCSNAWAQDAPAEAEAAEAAPVVMKGWTDGQAPQVSPKDFVPQLSTEEAYTERYTFKITPDTGGHIDIDMTLSNLGWGDGHGATRIKVERPNKPKYEFSKKVDRDKWTTSEDSLDLSIAGTTLKSLGPNAFEIEHVDGDTKLMLKFQNNVPTWMPGRGKIDVKDGGFFKFHVLAPRATVTGKMFHEGEWHEIKSTARTYADHTATNVAPFDLANRFSYFRAYEGDVTLVWREIKLGEEHGGESLTWILVGYKDQLVFADAGANLKYGSIREDETNGYRLPYAVQIDGTNAKDSIKLIMKGKRVKKTDLLANYGPAAKAVAGAVSNPFRYSFPCTFTLQMTIQGVSVQVKGKGSYTIDYVK